MLAVVAIGTGASIMTDAFDGLQLWGELFEVPLMSAMFLAMVWHARRRVEALETVEALADERASLLEQEERLLHDVSHELRTPVTIARGHLELLGRRLGDDQPELDGRLRRAAAHRADRRPRCCCSRAPSAPTSSRRPASGSSRSSRTCSCAGPRSLRARWRLGEILDVTLQVDETWLRAALDALLENAVQYTDDHARIELSARGEGHYGRDLASRTTGPGSPPTRSTASSSGSRAPTRPARGARAAPGLGLSIVAAIARAHGGSCTARSVARRAASVFELRFPLAHASQRRSRVEA